jgi:hypothetical protein
VDAVGMGMGMNGGLTVPLIPTMGSLWCLFAQLVALCVWILPPVNPSADAFQGSNP